eukprot:GEZU01012862.1.p1 GENE.GEZU01012862.1~~GEZU01012862.1.p1  ORF type:complete len:667 (+),score=169.94 GEZU01012862.1:289-2289(+)
MMASNCNSRHNMKHQQQRHRHREQQAKQATEEPLDQQQRTKTEEEIHCLHREFMKDLVSKYSPKANPFNYDYSKYGWNATPYEAAKTILRFPIFLLRFSVIFSIFIVAFVLLHLTMLGYKKKLNPKGTDYLPLPKWRRNLILCYNFLARVALFIGGFYWIKVKGKRDPNVKILIANHSTLLDFMYPMHTEFPMIVSKAEVGKWRLLRPYTEGLQVIFVDRKDPDSRKATRQTILNRCQPGSDYPSLLIFPEGTTTNRTCLIAFKTGAFLPGMPVQPMLLRYPHKHFNPSYIAMGPRSFVLAYRLFTQFVNYLEVEYMDPYYPSEEEKKDPQLFANNVRKYMAERLGVPTTEHSHEDVMLLTKARSMKLDNIPNFEFARLRELLTSSPNGNNGLSLDDMTTLMDIFKAIDLDHDSKLDINDFTSAIATCGVVDDAECKQWQYIRQLFDLFDIDDNGYVDYLEFVIGVYFCSMANEAVVDPEYKAHFAFHVYDRDQDGTIMREDIARVMRLALPANSAEKKAEEQEEASPLSSSSLSLSIPVPVSASGSISYDEFKELAKAYPKLVSLVSSALLAMFARAAKQQQEATRAEEVEEAINNIGAEENCLLGATTTTTTKANQQRHRQQQQYCNRNHGHHRKRNRHHKNAVKKRGAAATIASAESHDITAS